MTARTEKMEKLFDELALVVDGDRDAIARHADFLADDDEARDLKHDAIEIAQKLAGAGADYVPPADLEAKLLAALDARSGGGESTGDDIARLRRRSRRARAGRRRGEGAPQRRDRRHRADDGDARGAEGVARAARDRRRRRARSARADEPRPREGAVRKPSQMGKVILLFGALGIATAAAAAHRDSARADAGRRRGRDHAAGRTPDAGRRRDHGTRRADRALVERRRDRRSKCAQRAAHGRPSARRDGSGGRLESAPTSGPACGSRSRTARSSCSTTRPRSASTRSRRAASRSRRAKCSPTSPISTTGRTRPFTVPTGRVEVLGTKFVLAATPDMASVRVTRGSVRVHGQGGTSGEVKQGEEGVIRTTGTPEIAPVMDLARSVAWAELSNEVAVEQEADATLPGIGSLRAHRPGEREDRERPLHSRAPRRPRPHRRQRRAHRDRRGLPQRHRRGARGHLPLPAAAAARRSSGSRSRSTASMIEGAFVDRDARAAIWRGVIQQRGAQGAEAPREEIIWVPGPWRDPALLEWQRGGRFELRIFPIPAHGSRRVVLAYTQAVAPQAGGRRYIYPLAHRATARTRVGRVRPRRPGRGQRAACARSGYEVSSGTEEAATPAPLRADATSSRAATWSSSTRSRAATGELSRLDVRRARPRRRRRSTAARRRIAEVIALQRDRRRRPRRYVAIALRPACRARTRAARATTCSSSTRASRWSASASRARRAW